MAKRIDKIRESSGDELRVQERELTEQIFRLRFQLSTGQAEALKRLRDSRKDLARVKTHLRAQELNQDGAHIATQKVEKPEEAASKSAALKTKTAKRQKPKHVAKGKSNTKKAGKK
jgi:large subunit ribosomal protein L29